MPSQLLSVGDWLKMAVARFHAVSTSPQLDAEVLLETITGVHRSSIYARPEQLLTSEQIEDLEMALNRRARGEPIAYIVGRQEFWSMQLEVSRAVLIPRPETEILVEWALERVPLNDPARVLDLGTGSGAIALAIASARPHAQVVAVDVSHEALIIAERNRNTLGIRNVELLHADWFQGVTGRFDTIVSNPPYVATNDPELSPLVATFEPTRALIAGPTGLECLEHIIEAAPAFLANHGWLLLEHGWRQGAAVRALLDRQGFTRVRSRPDLAGHERVTEGQRL